MDRRVGLFLQLLDVNFYLLGGINMENKVKKTREEKIQANKELLEILRKKKENLEIQILNLETRIRNLERTPESKGKEENGKSENCPETAN